MKLSIYILTTIGLLFSGSLKAQFPTNIPQQGGSGFPTGNQQTGFPQRPEQDKTKQNTNGRIGLDDSTRVVYGPTSTKYFLEEDVFNNRKRLYTIDTTMDGIHNYNFVQRNKNLYTDLGNIGTAIRPIFYKAPEQIGTLLGYDAFSLYTIKPSQVRYFNTKSPFSNIIYVPGGNDQDLLQFELSRNIDSLWNVGINVQRISSNKQLIDRTATADNTAISHWDFMVHSNYQTKNKKYSLLAYFNLSDHNSNDQGGVVQENYTVDEGGSTVTKLRTLQEMLSFGGNRPKLTNASTRDKSYNFHVYHEYVGYKAFQIYQVIDFQTRKAQFKDADFSTNWQSGFYPYAFSSSNSTKGIRFPTDTTTAKILILDSLYNESQFSNLEFKTGLKGFYKDFNYRIHLRNRFLDYKNALNPIYSRPSQQEYFLGLWLNQYFKDSTRFFGEFEKSVDTKDFRLNGEFRGKWLNIGGNYTSTSPTFVQQATYNNSFRWQKTVDDEKKDSLVNVVNINVFAYTALKFKELTLRPSIDLSTISSYIYFDNLSSVRQANRNNNIDIVRVGLGLDYTKRKFSTTNQIFITPTSFGDSTQQLKQLIRIPAIFINSRLAYNFLFKKKLFIQTGVELHYKSGYYADAYMPAIQQFHLQDKQEVLGYLQADVFADLRINRVRLFVKFAHVNQGLFNGGYYASPGFAGMGRTFEFGVHWLLFD